MLLRLGLQNFKSFRQATVPLGPLTLIVGTNASGKSNLRDALRFLHGIGLGYPLAEILGEKYGPGGIQQWRGIRGGARETAYQGETQFTFEVLVSAPDRLEPTFSYRLTVDVSDLRFGPRVTEEGLQRRYGWDIEYYFNSHPWDDPVEQWGEHQIRVRYPRGGAYRKQGKVSDFGSMRPVLSQLSERADEPKKAREACAAVLEVFRSIRFLDLDPEAMRQPSQPGQVILGDRGENLSSVLQSICADEQTKETLLGWVRALTPLDVNDLEFLTDFTGRVLVHFIETEGRKISAVSASDGTLRFLAMVAALLSPDTGRIYVFEEFDNGIHPTRLHLLLELVQQACRQQGVQVIGTTHNPAMLAFLDQDARKSALLVYRKDAAPDSRVRPIADLPDIETILDSQDLGRLHASGWLEHAAVFSEDEENKEDEEEDEDEDEEEDEA